MTTVFVPMTFRRIGGRKRIVLPDGSLYNPETRVPVDSPIVRSLARAFRWRRLLESGRHASINELAKAERVDRAFASRVLRLTLLAPLAEIGRHTAETYGDVKARLADHYLDISRRAPRWLENWQDRASGQMLQVDENDLWIVAQAVERDYLLVTSDQRLADRFSPAIPELRLSVV